MCVYCRKWVQIPLTNDEDSGMLLPVNLVKGMSQVVKLKLHNFKGGIPANFFQDCAQVDDL